MRRAVCTLLLFIALPAGAQRFDTLVKNAGAPRHAGAARLVPEVTIGGADETSDEYLFSGIRHFLAAADGSVWVIDGKRVGQAVAIRRYDVSGKFMRNVGRRGDGPGEWYQPSSLSQLRDGRVVLRDAVVGRAVNFYRPNGDLDTTWSYKTSTVYSVRGDTSGALWMQVQEGVTFRSTSPLVTLRLKPDGSIIDTVFDYPLPRLLPANFRVSNDRVTSMVTAPYQAYAGPAWSPFGFTATAVTSRYAIDFRFPRTLPNGTIRPWRPGDRVTSVRRRVDPVVVTEAERSDQRKHMEAQADNIGSTRLGSVPDVPRVKPPIKHFKFDIEGRLWVRVAQPSERYEPAIPQPLPGRAPPPVIKWREPVAYDLFEANGTYVGRIPVPFELSLVGDNQAIVQARGNSVWGVAKDDDGVESLVRYLIVWP
jgi:hypothetical protein